ncbi:hypothetical protein R8Z57_11405 [Microbacterium sp. M3]|uniref:Uncharacterized protein n=1 Tax=Microbacterium arthrosphaerae TaxID=792652 RepID=A0ABU4H217_9MICO|nr:MULTISPECIES: hypothetical protein [Microbacterium]MDW4573377.1 hypothetical protein [Microbacterium arthrosphaerae]MDW7607232.1 hypothetical protein [Microbacterium sp. M3]
MAAGSRGERRVSTRRRIGVFAAALSLIGALLLAPTAAEVDPAAAAVPSASTAAPATIAKMADLSQFQPGHIISDAKFFDRGTMSEAQIQQFLQSKVPNCQAGYVCLKDWYDTSRATNADAMCGAYPGGYRERASAIIYKVAQACGINPQVILVMLQKEQGLVNHTWPSDWRYTIAMGQGCPDTAACDTRYYGFFNQVYGAAWQLKRYANPPGTSQFFTWYAPGKTWNVRWHPNAACGSAPVHIQNQATANLYYYTPYQPNAAAIRAGYGEGDACSAYGNRNFFQYFTDWFGSVSGETLQVLQVSGTSERYVVSQGARWRLATAEMAAQFTWISPVRDVSRSEIDGYPDRGPADRAIRTLSGIVYLLDSGERFAARDVYQVADFGWDYGGLPVASDAQAARYRDGGSLERVVRSDGTSWLIQSGTRREILDLSMLPRYGIPALATNVSRGVIAEYPVAAPVLGVGIYRDAANPPRIVTDGGVYTLPEAASGTAVAGASRTVTSESFAFLNPVQSMPQRMTSAGRSYVLLDDGWLEVSVADYPARLPFTSLPPGAAAGLPSAGRVASPHFLRERSDAQVYLISGGTMQAVSSADQAFITRTYGVNPRVWVALDGTIADGTSMAEGLVRTSAGAAYLLDGARAYRFRDCGQVAAWGSDCNTLRTVSATSIGTYANAGTLRDLVKAPSGTIWLAQGGQFRQVLDPGILAMYGISTTASPVSAATAATLPVGEPVLTAGVYTDGGSGRIVVTQGGEYTLTDLQATGVVAASARSLTAASFAKITVDGPLPSRMRSDGRAFVLTREGWLEVSAAAYGGDGVFTPLASRAWTGITVAGNEQRPHYIRDEATSLEYLVSGGAIQFVAGSAERAAITSTYGVPTKVWPVVGGVVAGLRLNYDLVVKDASGAVFLIDGTTRYRMSGCGAAGDFGRDCASIRTLTAAQLSGLSDGGNLAPLLRSSEGYVWLVQGGARREVPDPRVLAAYGIGTGSTPVSAGVMSQLRLGQPVVGVGTYDDRAGDVRVITGDGRTFALPTAGRIGSLTAAAWPISPASIDLLKTEGDLPTRVSTGSQTYILTTEGWLGVSASSYSGLSFATIGARATEGLPSAGSELRPHFVREYPDAQIYLASGGLGAVTDPAALAWISSTYGVPSKVWVVPDGTLG